jgi:hypothetical protein
MKKILTSSQVILQYNATLSLTVYLTTLTWFTYVSDLNKLIKQEQNKAVPSNFTLFTKQ